MDKSYGMVGLSQALKYVLFKAEQVAPTDSTVLILGESGTGKEHFACAIHAASARQNRPLVKLDCAALPPRLVESELFGHERGASADAWARKVGRFELAHRGTLFLDEVGELPPDLQPRLLRVLEAGEFERVGGTRTRKVDVRVIAATSRDLRREAESGRFRADLLDRLSVYPITVPPLRRRKDDIPPLVEFFVNQFNRKAGKAIRSVPPDVMRALRDYEWPGNVRELAGVIERAVVVTEGAEMSLADRLGAGGPGADHPAPEEP